VLALPLGSGWNVKEEQKIVVFIVIVITKQRQERGKQQFPTD
jgi:hypothetical protein